MPKKEFKGLAKDFINSMKMQFIGQGADPNKIIVQDLFTYESPTQNPAANKFKLKANSLDELRAMSAEDRQILQTLLAVYNEHIETKREVLTQARNLFDTDIIQTVIDVMIDDGFNSFQNENEEFKIEYILDDDDLENLGEEYQEQVQNLIDEFVEKFALKTRVAELVPELLRDGEYALGVLFDEENKKGITEIVDDFDVINLLPFYENDKLAFVINQNNFSDKQTTTNFIGNFYNENKPVAYKPDNMVFFRLNGPTKLRINMSNFYNKDFQKIFHDKTGIRLPKYIRTSLPIFYGAIKNLNRLKIMENVSTVLDLNDVLKPEIVHVVIPTNTSAPEAEQIIRDYERHLNDMSGFSAEDSLELGTLMAQANRRKVLPQWMDTKGTLSSAAVNQGAKGAGAWESVDRLRNLIALGIGIPPYYINITGQPIDKAQTIKLYSRYTRKLTALQKTLADGIKDILMIHLEHCGLNISRTNLSIKFRAITSADALDDVDLLVGLVAGVSDMYKALHEITSADDNKLVLDDEQFKAFFDNRTATYLNMSNLIRIDEDKFENIEGEDLGPDSDFEMEGPSRRDREEPEAPDININIDNGPDQGEEVYNDFVQASTDIGIEGTEPSIEEI